MSGVPEGTLAGRLAGRDNALNFLRLILASSVLISHAFLLSNTAPPSRLFYPSSGDLAVDGFFALSGYLIAGARVKSSLPVFFWRRIIRIMPGFWVCLAVIAFGFAPLEATLAGERWSPISSFSFVGRNFFLVLGQTYIDHTLLSVPSASYGGSQWSGPLWTLAWEFGAYIACGLILSVAWVRRHGLIVFGVIVAALYAGMRWAWLGAETTTRQGLRLGLFFAAGSLLFFAGRVLLARWWLAGAAAAAFVVLYEVGLEERYGALFFAYILLWLGGVLPIRVGSRNDISYGMYVFGWPVQQTLIAVWPTMHVGLYFVAALILTIPLAATSWLLIERHALRLRDAPKHGWRLRETLRATPL